MDKWYKLDNAAKIFPPTFSRISPANFRLSSIFFDEIKEEELQKALDVTLSRFEMFNVQLKKGLFWYYLEKRNTELKIKEESPFIYQSLDINKYNGELLNVFYYGKRICLEIWHGLTDATGAMEFLKALCFNYLNLLNENIENNGTILTKDIIQDETEEQDSFVFNHDENVKGAPKPINSYVIEGKLNEHDNIDVFHGLFDVEEVKANAQKYNSTLTEYIGGVMLYSLYKTYSMKNPYDEKFILFIPVNSRKFFSSKTLKNFMLYIRTTLNTYEVVTLENTIKCIKKTLREELTQDYLKSVLSSNVVVEKNLAIKLTPLYLKNFVMNTGYKLIGKGKATIVFSNLGVVETPDKMKKFIDRFEFGISPSQPLPITFSGVSYNGKLVLTFSKKIEDKELIKNFFSLMSQENKVIINSNEREGE